MTSQEKNDSPSEATIGMAVNTATNSTDSPIIAKPKGASRWEEGCPRRFVDGWPAPRGDGGHQLAPAAFSRSACSPSRAALALPEEIAWVVRWLSAVARAL